VNHAAEFAFVVHTGTRLSEQLSQRWKQVDLDRRQIMLTLTKNSAPCTVFLNQTAVDALRSLQRKGQKLSGLVFPRAGGKGNFDTRS
jgi:integrase